MTLKPRGHGDINADPLPVLETVGERRDRRDPALHALDVVRLDAVRERGAGEANDLDRWGDSVDRDSG